MDHKKLPIIHPATIALQNAVYIKIPVVDEHWQATGKQHNILIYSHSGRNESQYNALVDLMYGRDGHYASGSTTIGNEDALSLNTITGHASTGELTDKKLLRVFKIAAPERFEAECLSSVGTVITLSPNDVKTYIDGMKKDYQNCCDYFGDKKITYKGGLCITDNEFKELAEHHPELYTKWMQNGQFSSLFSDETDKSYYLDYHPERKTYMKTDYADDDEEKVEKLRKEGYVQVYKVVALNDDILREYFYGLQLKSNYFLDQVQKAVLGLDIPLASEELRFQA